MKPGQRRATQKCRVATKDQAHEILEHRLLDGIAVKLQDDAIKPIDVDQRYRNHAGLIVGTK